MLLFFVLQLLMPSLVSRLLDIVVRLRMPLGFGNRRLSLLSFPLSLFPSPACVTYAALDDSLACVQADRCGESSAGIYMKHDASTVKSLLFLLSLFPACDCSSFNRRALGGQRRWSRQKGCIASAAKGREDREQMSVCQL